MYFHDVLDGALAGALNSLITFCYRHRRRKGQWLGGTMASAGHEPITGVWGQSPQRGPGAEPVVRGSAPPPPPEAESILVIGCPTEPANLAPVRENSMFCYGPLVSELGGGRVPVPPPAPPPMAIGLG